MLDSLVASTEDTHMSMQSLHHNFILYHFIWTCKPTRVTCGWVITYFAISDFMTSCSIPGSISNFSSLLHLVSTDTHTAHMPTQLTTLSNINVVDNVYSDRQHWSTLQWSNDRHYNDRMIDIIMIEWSTLQRSNDRHYNDRMIDNEHYNNRQWLTHCRSITRQHCLVDFAVCVRE